MRVGVLQSNYLPWRGYFDFINSVDLFIFHDDIQYTKQDWRNRNKVKMPNGTEWITVPVKGCPTRTMIDEVEISGCGWFHVHKHKLRQSLDKAEYFRDAMDIFSICEYRYDRLSDLNIALIKRVCRYLEINTPFIHSRRLELTGAKTDRLIQMLKKVGGTTYLSGPAAKCYLDVEAMNREGIAVEWKRYDYEPYPQQHGEFNGAVTVLDLIANVGKDAKNHITSK